MIKDRERDHVFRYVRVGGKYSSSNRRNTSLGENVTKVVFNNVNRVSQIQGNSSISHVMLTPLTSRLHDVRAVVESYWAPDILKHNITIFSIET